MINRPAGRDMRYASEETPRALSLPSGGGRDSGGGGTGTGGRGNAPHGRSVGGSGTTGATGAFGTSATSGTAAVRRRPTGK
ncbi:hypothetical protein [Streptomyces incarnatus]|nr:hypothetical protein [Streptomyces incarnatus]